MSLLCADPRGLLRPASFRGAGFFVKADTGKYGRRIAYHEFPMRDVPFPEDLGKKGRTFHVTGYTAGAEAWAMKDAVVAACEARGPALLRLPAESGQMCVCISLDVQRSLDEIGVFRLEMEFREAGSALAIAPVSIIASAISMSFGAIGTAMATMFNAAYTFNGVLNFVTDNAAARLVGAASAVTSMLETYSIALPSEATRILRFASELSDNATEFANPSYQSYGEYESGASTPTYTSSGYFSTVSFGASLSSSGFVTQADTDTSFTSTGEFSVPTYYPVLILTNIAAALPTTLSPDVAFTALMNLSKTSIEETTAIELPSQATKQYTDPATSKTYSVSETADMKNSTVFHAVFRGLVLVAAAQAAAQTTFKTRKEAIKARADLVEAFYAVLSVLMDEAVAKVLLDARDNGVKAITKAMADIAPVVTVYAPQPMPSLYWAYRLYSDPTRAEELFTRNSVKTPAFMPRSFEALTE